MSVRLIELHRHVRRARGAEEHEDLLAHLRDRVLLPGLILERLREGERELEESIADRRQREAYSTRVPDVVVYVDVPSGSRNKYELDPELGPIVLDRRLFTSMA